MLDYASYQAGKNDSFFSLEKINGQNLTSLEGTIKTLEAVRAGDSVTLTFRRIQASRSFMSTQYFLSGDSFDMTITASQYVYSMPA